MAATVSGTQYLFDHRCCLAAAHLTLMKGVMKSGGPGAHHPRQGPRGV